MFLMPGSRALRSALRELAQIESYSLSTKQLDQAQKNIGIPTVLRGYLGGMTISTPGSSVLFTVTAGAATDSTSADVMTLSASMQKAGNSAWSAGASGGSLDTGALAASTWYHVHIIKNPTTQAVDILTSLSATSPTLPAGYTIFRRIGAMKTTAGTVWASFTQLGDEFLWASAVNDVNTGTLGTTPTLYTLGSVPTGVQVIARFRGTVSNAAAGTAVLINSPDETAVAVNTPAGNFTSDPPNASSGTGALFTLDVRTNTSGQVRAVAGAASTTIWMTTYGYYDTRGRYS